MERVPGTSSEVVGDRCLVVDPDGRHVLTLSPTGSLVWAAIDGRRDDTALARHLLERTRGGTPERAEADVARFLAELQAAGLVRRVDAPG